MSAGDSAYPALITAETLEERLDDPALAVLEVTSGRTDADYRRGHVPGARWANWEHLLWNDLTREFRSPGDLAARLGALGISGDATLVVYGDPIQFGSYAYWALALGGQRDVLLLDGGKECWLAAGHPITSVHPDVHPAPPRPHGDPEGSIRVGRDQVLAAIGDGWAQILDVRTDIEYRGERVSPPGAPVDTGAVRAGHIPGARNVFFRDFLRDDSTFRPAEETRGLLAGHGLSAQAPIIAYCRLSHRSSLAWFAISRVAGVPGARVYDGSWTEWGSMVGTPIER